MTTASPERRIKTICRGIDAVGALLACGIFAGSSLLIDGVIAPQLQQAQSKSEALRRFIRGGATLKSEHHALAAREAEVEQRMANSRAKIPERPSESEFLAQLTNLASASGLSIRDYAPGATTRLPEHHAVEVEVSAEGDHAGLCRFLDGLPRLARLCRVTGLDVEAPKHDASKYPIRLRIEIFFQPRAEEEV
jgi:Tfp pilus assembly protein PilO